MLRDLLRVERLRSFFERFDFDLDLDRDLERVRCRLERAGDEYLDDSFCRFRQ